MNNEPAFPFTEMHTHGSPYTQWKGMTLRDYFAAKAMQGQIARTTYHIEDDPTDISIEAYAYADAMLKARNGNS